MRRYPFEPFRHPAWLAKPRAFRGLWAPDEAAATRGLVLVGLAPTVVVVYYEDNVPAFIGVAAREKDT